MTKQKQSDNKSKWVAARRPASRADAKHVSPAVEASAEDALEAEAFEAHEADTVLAEATEVEQEALSEAPAEAAFAAKIVLVASEGDSAPRAAAWTIAWPGVSFELWNENTSAFLEFTKALSAAKTPSEVVALQTRFTSERLTSFLRHAQDFATQPKTFFFAA